MYKKLSVLIPVYNEKDTIKACVERVLDADISDLELEIIISDNNSYDGTKEILKSHKLPILHTDKGNSAIPLYEKLGYKITRDMNWWFYGRI